jgi:hypothetical protein
MNIGDFGSFTIDIKTSLGFFFIILDGNRFLKACLTDPGIRTGAAFQSDVSSLCRTF